MAPSNLQLQTQMNIALLIPKPGQIWVNKQTNKRATIAKVIDYDRVLLRYSPHESFDCCYELFIETHSIDVEESIKNLQSQVESLLADIAQLKNY